MSKRTLRVLTQILDNKGTPSSPLWKPAGNQEFLLKADIDLYLDDVCVASKIIKEMVEKHCDASVQYEIKSIEIVLEEPIVLCENTFESKMIACLNACDK